MAWPGGPSATFGHGGCALWTLPATGAGVGVAWGVGPTVGRGVGATVGLGVGARVGANVGAGVGANVGRGVGGAGVGATVGRGVGATVGRGVGWAGVGVGWAGVGVGATTGATVGSAGVGVGMTATIGPPVGIAVEADGSTDGSNDEPPVDDVGAALPPPEINGVGSVAGVAVTGADVGLGRPTTPATSPGRLGDRNPAVSATVARMRLRSPMATTNRAR